MKKYPTYPLELKRAKYKGKDVGIYLTSYAIGGYPALIIGDEETQSTVAKCTLQLDNQKQDECIVKDYSENEGMYDFLLSEGIINKYHRFEGSGYVSKIPVCYLSDYSNSILSKQDS